MSRCVTWLRRGRTLGQRSQRGKLGGAGGCGQLASAWKTATTPLVA
jgi:hypothetical protein